MKFINRESEKSALEEAIMLSSKKLYSIVIYGSRRVGKTRLILEFLANNGLYFFVNKDKTSKSLLEEYEENLRKKKTITELESLKNWDDFFKIIFERFKGAVVFDEFQNFIHVDKSIFGILQKYIDLNEERKELLFIFSGSTIGLVKKLFLSSKEPLYGRVKRKLHIKPLSFFDSIKMCREVNIQDLENIIKVYSVFGGFPRYYVAIEDENLHGKKFEDVIEKFFFVENSVFEDEVETILSMEFGRRSGIYYDILTAIANGCTRISDIASFLRKKETGITRQLNELVNYFEIVGMERQLLGNKRIMYIKHPLINFWFRFFYKSLSEYKKRDPYLLTKIKSELNSYIGGGFEIICREEILPNLMPNKFIKIGKQWGKIPKTKEVYEIDIVALNEKTKEILLCECKWKDRINAKKIANELAEKAQYVQWNNEDRKESIAIFAKSFSKRIGEFEGRKVYCFDLRDLERFMKRGIWKS